MSIHVEIVQLHGNTSGTDFIFLFLRNTFWVESNVSHKMLEVNTNQVEGGQSSWTTNSTCSTSPQSLQRNFRNSVYKELH
jgi:hypothetical protein